MKKIIICLVSLLSFNLHAALANQALAALWITPPGDTRPLLIDKKTKIVNVHKREKNIDKKYLINVSYPQIQGTTGVQATSFNSRIVYLIQQKIKHFKQRVAIADSLPLKTENSLNIDYALASFVSQSQHNQIVSIRFEINIYQRGMAHPAQNFLSVNYDLQHHQSLTLASLFKPESHYLTIIADHCVSSLHSKLPDFAILKAGCAPKISNFKNWNLTLSGLLITFDEAQIAPRVYGKQQVLIPQDVLRKLLTHKAACTIGVIPCEANG